MDASTISPSSFWSCATSMWPSSSRMSSADSAKLIVGDWMWVSVVDWVVVVEQGRRVTGPSLPGIWRSFISQRSRGPLSV